MKLFELTDKYEVQVSEEAWALVPFKELLKKDKSKDKTTAVKEMTFIFFYCDLRSDYQDILDDEERAEAIKKDVKLPVRWKIDAKVQAAIDFYKVRMTTITSRLLSNSLYIANKVSNVMKTVVEEDDVDIDKLAKVTKALQDIPKVVLSLQQTEKAVLKEIESKKSKVGSKDKALFEDINLMEK
jgi:hypothetical protein